MKLSTTLIWFALILSTGIIDWILFWGGYHGILNVFSLVLLKPLFICLSGWLLLWNLRRYVKERCYSAICVGILTFVILVSDFLYMRGSQSPFFWGATAGLRNSIDPVLLQSWAEKELAQDNSSYNIFIDPKDLPSFLKIDSWPQEPGAGIRNTEGVGLRHIEIAWGSGVVGNYGIAVGPPGFVTTGCFLWKPGIYFYYSP